MNPTQGDKRNRKSKTGQPFTPQTLIKLWKKWVWRLGPIIGATSIGYLTWREHVLNKQVAIATAAAHLAEEETKKAKAETEQARAETEKVQAQMEREKVQTEMAALKQSLSGLAITNTGAGPVVIPRVPPQVDLNYLEKRYPYGFQVYINNQWAKTIQERAHLVEWSIKPNLSYSASDTLELVVQVDQLTYKKPGGSDASIMNMRASLTMDVSVGISVLIKSLPFDTDSSVEKLHFELIDPDPNHLVYVIGMKLVDRGR